MKNRLIAIITLIFSFIVTSGCSSIEIVELNERLIIEAIGIDYNDGVYNITIEGLDSFSSGSESSSISAPSLTKCFMFQGKTIGMAMNSISVITGQIPLFSQARVLILGPGTAETKLSESLDFFRREYTTRTDILIAIAKESAEAVVSADFGQNISAGNVIEAALESSRYTGNSCYMPLYKFINSVLSKTDTPFCPLISTKTNPFTGKEEVSLLGTTVLGKTNNGTLSPEQTLGLNILNNKIQNGDISIETPDGLCTLEIISCKTKKQVKIIEGKAVFHIRVRLLCDIPEYQSEAFSGLSKKDIEKIAQLSSEKIALMLSELIDNIYFLENEDIFNFGRMINLTDNSFYSDKYTLNNIIDSVEKCDLDISLSIRRIGKIILAEE